MLGKLTKLLVVDVCWWVRQLEKIGPDAFPRGCIEIGVVQSKMDPRLEGRIKR
jgi:hypothetical protein